jgi:phosphoglycolate phosphatase-like HAD superfamily hydrolase
MLCEFATMPKPVPASQLHFTPMGTTDIRTPRAGFSFAAAKTEHGTQLTQIKAVARAERDMSLEKSEEEKAKDYPLVDEALAPLNALQVRVCMCTHTRIPTRTCTHIPT